MRKLEKYAIPVSVDTKFTLNLKPGAEILRVGKLRNCPYIWVLENTACKLVETRSFITYGIQQEIQEPKHSITYLGMVSLFDDSFEMHIFEDCGVYNELLKTTN